MGTFLIVSVLLVGSLLKVALQEVDYTDLPAVLLWISLAGGPYISGWLFSLLAENWPAWHGFPKQVKFALPLLLSVLLSIGANVLLSQNEVVAMIQPYWRMIAMAVLMYLGSQVAYMNVKRTGYGSNYKLTATAWQPDQRE